MRVGYGLPFFVEDQRPLVVSVSDVSEGGEGGEGGKRGWRGIKV